MTQPPEQTDRRRGPPPPPPFRRAAAHAETVVELIDTLWQKPAVRLGVYLIAVPLGVWVLLGLLHTLASVLVIILLAYGIAFLCNPMLNWLERHRVGRGLGVMLVLILGLAIVTAIVMTLTSQVQSMFASLPQLAQALKELLSGVLDRFANVQGAEGLRERIMEAIDKQFTMIQQGAGPLAERIMNAGPDVMRTLESVVGWLGEIGFIVTLAMYFMFDYEGVGRTMVSVFPKRWQPTIVRLSDDVSESFGAYLRGTLLTTIACIALATVGLMLLKVPNALAIGLISGFINLFPYIGIVLASFVAMIQAVPLGTTTILLVALLYFIINQLLGNVIGPIIMGRTTQLTASTILVALLIGLSIGGLAGALLAIPVATLIKRWIERYWLPSRTHEGDPDDAPAGVLGEPELDPVEVMSDLQPDEPGQETKGLSDGTV